MPPLRGRSGRKQKASQLPLREDSNFSKSCTHLRIHGCKARERGKAEGMRGPQWVREVNRRTLPEGPGLPRCGSHMPACFSEVPKSLRSRLTQVHTAADPLHPMWVTHQVQRPQTHWPEQVAHTLPCDLVTPQITLLGVIADSPQSLAPVRPVCLLNGAPVPTI